MNCNRLRLNDNKTEFTIFGSTSTLQKVRTTSIHVGDSDIAVAPSMRNIGAYMESRMMMDSQVTHMCKSAWFHLFSTSKIRCYLTTEQTTTVVHAYVTSKLDCNNALLTGFPQKLLSKLQRVQKAVAMLISGSTKRDHVTPILHDLHWLPIHLF